jgi:hypothetical protein
MSGYVFILFAAIHGAVCASANINFFNWQYWILLACVCGAYICGAMLRK